MCILIHLKTTGSEPQNNRVRTSKQQGLGKVQVCSKQQELEKVQEC